MNMRVIAEGVEEKSQLDLIRELGVDEVQGFLLGRPGPNPANVLQAFLAQPSQECPIVPAAALSLS